MLPINKKLKLLALGIACSFALAFLANILFIAVLPLEWDLSKHLDQFFYRIFFKPGLKPEANLVIIDSGTGAGSRARADYADLITRLCEAQASCIALDIYFAGESRQDSAGDRALVESVQACSLAVLAADFSSPSQPSAMASNLAERLALPDSVCQNIFINQIFAPGAILPFDALLAATAHLGHINSVSNEHHHFPPTLTYQRKCYAALPVQMARLYFAAHDSSLRLEDMPINKYGQVFINFIPVEDFKPYPYSWSETQSLLREQPEKFRGAMIFVVNPTEEPEVQTPLGLYPRWALLASLASQLVQNRYIEESDLFYPLIFSAALVSAGLFWLLFWAPRLDKKWRKTRFLFASGNFLMLLIIFLTLRYGQVWLGVVIPLLTFNVTLAIVRARYYRWVTAPEYLDFGLAVLERQGENYPIQIFESPAGEEEGNTSFPSFLEEASLRATLEKFRALNCDRQELKTAGERFFQALFPNEIANALKASLHHVTNEKKNLRLKLRLDAPELVRLPWELLHDAKLPPGFLTLHQRVSLVRYLALAQPLKDGAFRVPLTILVGIASPLNLPPLDVEAEKRMIKKSLRPLIWSCDVRLRFCDHLTLDKLVRELERKPDVLHYIGHGKFDAAKNEALLEFESETGEALAVEGEAVGNLLHESAVKLAVLNSCEGAVASDTDAFSGVAQILVRVGVPAVVAMQYPIRDATAITFAKSFYTNLAGYHSIDAAVAEARRDLMTKTGLGQLDWATPVLFMRQQSGRIFAADEKI